MKLSIVLCNAILVATTLQVAAVALPARIHRFCFMPGEVCTTRLKRAPHAIEGSIKMPGVEALQARHSFEHNFCHMPGEPCSKAKRSMLALAEALEKTEDDAADSEAKSFAFHARESAAVKFRRNVEAHEADAIAYFKANPDMKFDTTNNDPICDQPDGPCTQLNKAKELVKAAITKRSAGREPKDAPESQAIYE